MTTATVVERKGFTHLDERLEIVGIVADSGTPCVQFRLLHRPVDAVGAGDFRETGALEIPAYLIGRAIRDLPKLTRRCVEAALVTPSLDGQK
jgi:hypothetical protein